MGKDFTSTWRSARTTDFPAHEHPPRQVGSAGRVDSWCGLSRLGQIYYTARDLTLKRLGFKSYRDYLRSKTWKGIKSVVRQLRGRHCSCCHRLGPQIHHTDYSAETLAGKRLTSLYPICDKCHTEIERMKDGEKSTPAFANRRFFALKARKDRVAAIEMRDWLKRHGIKT